MQDTNFRLKAELRTLHFRTVTVLVGFKKAADQGIVEAAASISFLVTSVEADALLHFTYCIVHQPLGLDSVTAFVCLGFVQFPRSGSQCLKRRLHVRLVRSGLGARR
jgi:hypothetical protein